MFLAGSKRSVVIVIKSSSLRLHFRAIIVEGDQGPISELLVSCLIPLVLDLPPVMGGLAVEGSLGVGHQSD